MRSWPLVLLLLAAGVAVIGIRHGMRDSVVRAIAARTRSLTVGGARTHALAWFGISTAVAVGADVLAWWLSNRSAPWDAVRFVPVLLVVLVYVPVVTLGAPKMTRWQRTLERRLVDAGAPRDPAHAVATIARPFSAVGLLVGLAAVLIAVA